MAKIDLEVSDDRSSRAGDDFAMGLVRVLALPSGVR
jgi:hypothetical protein